MSRSARGCVPWTGRPYGNPLRNILTISLILLSLALVSVFVVGASGAWNRDWRSASRESAGIAPDPARTPEAVVQLYAARAFNWRGIFGVHTWIAAKEPGARTYVVYQVVGWRLYRGLPVVVAREDIPDRLWFDSRPAILADLRGAAAERAIPAIRRAAESYPYPNSYRLWPGPNSNTFTAYVARRVPELEAALPSNALGKDYLDQGQFLARTPSGTGWQLSLYGLLGAAAAVQEGLEINLLGLVFGLDVARPALKLPLVDRIGVSRDLAED